MINLLYTPNAFVAYKHYAGVCSLGCPLNFVKCNPVLTFHFGALV